VLAFFLLNSRGGCNPVKSRGGCNPLRSRGGSLPVKSRGGCSLLEVVVAFFLFNGYSNFIPVLWP